MIRSLSVVAALLFLVSCGQRVIKADPAQNTEQRKISDEFNAIEIDAPVDAVITVDSSRPLSFQLTGAANILPYIKTKVKNGKLKIYVEEIYELETDHNVVAAIGMPTLRGMDISGSSKVTVNGTVSGAKFSSDVSGVGSIAIQSINTNELHADISGTGALSIASGHTENAHLELSGSGSIAAAGMAAEHATVDVSGAGGVEINAVQTLNADISGAGSVHYKGQPQITKDVSGAGSVTAIP